MSRQLSPNFRLDEFLCRCGCGLDRIAPELVSNLQKIRDMVGKPITVISGCRCPAHNSGVGGEPHSFHLEAQGCKAADIMIAGKTVEEMAAVARKVPAFKKGGIGKYPGQHFVHLDVRGYMARWVG